MAIGPFGKRFHHRPEKILSHRQRKAVVVIAEAEAEITLVAAERLIAAKAGERHLHILTGIAAQIPGRDGRMIGKGLVERTDDLIENATDCRDHLEFLMLRLIADGDLARQPAFIEIAADIAAETHAEGAHRLAAKAAHRRHHGAGIDAAAEKAP